MSSPPDPSTAKPRMRLRTVMIFVVVGVLALLAASTVVVVGLYGFARDAGLFVDLCPAKRDLEGVDAQELLRVARALGTDVAREGVYWNAAAPAPKARIERPANARDLAGLPAIIRDMAPLQATVGGGGMTLTWDGPGYDYGYSMILLPDGADEARMTRDNGSSHWTEKIQDGIWSFHAFH